MVSAITVTVGSTNPVKVEAAKSAFQTLYPGALITSFQAEPGITDWRSKHALGQPFGAQQTAFGAIHRMEHCWKETFPDYAVGFENGLIPKGDRWFDICFTAIRTRDSVLVKRGGGVKTEFEAPLDADQKTFDASVIRYHDQIMPKIYNKEDLYLGWTKDLPGGARTRESFLSEALSGALQELQQLTRAKELIELCGKGGMGASNGPRYRHMLWTRDLAYMAPAYLKQGHKEAYWNALRQIAAAQCRKHEPHHNGYEQYDPFGKIPIVCIAPDHQLPFLALRLSGWRQQLPDDFPPLPPIENIGSARKYYNELLAFRKENAPNTPGPSFALRHFMEGTLEDLTPGTRDSEIQFIRALFSLLEYEPENKGKILEEFHQPLAYALIYLFNNVLRDGLPLGADSRDIFADLLYDAKTLTNALFFQSALRSLATHANDLDRVRDIFHTEQPLVEFFNQKLHQLTESIQRHFLFENGQFNPRDFIPGERTFKGLDHPVNPSPIDSIIKEDNPQFIEGRTADPQSLAQAVLAGLIEPRYYDEVIQLFAKADSPIGIQVFVPISGKTKKESDLLKAVKGAVIWPHVSWTVVRALIAMGTEASLEMAENQRAKLTRLTGLGEWYAIDPETKESIQGGDPEQGWSASSLILAMDDFYQYYARSTR